MVLKIGFQTAAMFHDGPNVVRILVRFMCAPLTVLISVLTEVDEWAMTQGPCLVTSLVLADMLRVLFLTLQLASLYLRVSLKVKMNIRQK